MIWVAIAIVVVAVVALAIGCRAKQPDIATYRAVVDLHTIRRRQEVAQFKGQVRRQAATARRELRAELSELDRGER